MGSTLREISVGESMEIRYALDIHGDWLAVAWRVMKGRWHRCLWYSRPTQKTLGTYRMAERGSLAAARIKAGRIPQ